MRLSGQRGTCPSGRVRTGLAYGGHVARRGTGSTLVTSQLPLDAWHAVIDEPTFAKPILDRLIHTYRLDLDGPSLRKLKAGEEARQAKP